FSFAQRFGKGPVKAGTDGAKEKFGLHGGERGGQPSRKIRKEEDGGAEERTQNGGFPVPALEQDRERVAQQAEEDAADRAVGALRARAVKGEGRQICSAPCASVFPGSARKRPEAKERPGWHDEAVTLRKTFRCIQNWVNPL